MPLLHQILETQSMHSFYQRLLYESIKQHKYPSAPVFNPPASMKTVLSIQTLNELAKAKARPITPQQKVYLTTQELLMPGVMDEYKKKGLFYVRRRILSFRESLRNPTIGCHIELLRFQEPCSYHIDTVKGQKLIYKICYA
jgi:hypothetical protein